MNYRIPYILTFLSFASFSYLLATYSYIQNQLTQTFQISKTQFGVIYSISALGSAIGTIIYIVYTVKITSNIVNYYSIGNIGFNLPHLAIIFISTIYEHPHKSVLYISLFIIGYFRSFYFPSILIMIKIHKEITQKKSSISENNYKLLLLIWSVSFDIGLILGFFISNWTNVSLELNWRWIMLIGVVFNLLSALLLHILLKNYMQKQYFQTVLSAENLDQKALQSEKKVASFPALLKLIKSYWPSIFFLINATVLDIKHTCFGMIMPPYFYSIGYQGKQGYLLALTSCFIIIGTWLFSVFDYLLNKLFAYFNKKSLSINQIQKIKSKTNQKSQNKEDKVVFPFTSSISLFFYFIITLLLAFNALSTKNQGSLGNVNYTVPMIYMCLMGFFFGGPAQGYFSYHVIRVMDELQERHKQNLEKLNKCIDQQRQETQINQEKSCLKTILHAWKTRKFRISSSLITLNCLFFQLGTIPFFILCFYIIQTDASLLFFFLCSLGFIIFTLDLIQNIMIYRSIKNKIFQKNQLKQDI